MLQQQQYYCYHELESSFVEYCKVEFVRSLSSMVIKVVSIVLKVIAMSRMH